MGEGTGLGLSVSYGIITKCGGNIIFTSYPAEEYPEKHGTTFTVYLPVATDTDAGAAAASLEEESSTPTGTITY